LEGSGSGLREIFSQQLLGGIEKNYEGPQSRQPVTRTDCQKISKRSTDYEASHYVIFCCLSLPLSWVKIFYLAQVKGINFGNTVYFKIKYTFTFSVQPICYSLLTQNSNERYVSGFNKQGFPPLPLQYMNGFRIWCQVVKCLRHKQDNLWQVSVLFSISPKPENAFKFTTMAIT
jgi:hypothetical protein